MKKLKRFLALLLVACMMTGLVPVNAILVDAAGDSTIVIAGSDYQKSGSTEPKDSTSNILKQIQKNYTTADGFLFGGDYTQSLDNASATKTGKEELQEVVQSVYGNSMKEVYVQGNHDPDSATTDGTLSTSGAHDTDNYGVYVINEKDYPWGYYHASDMQAKTKATAEALDSYLDAKVNEGYKKPVFVLSHLPLHYTSRTSSQGDGKYAKYLYDVLDQAGDKGLNIIFLFGHNHSSGYDAYLGNGSIYLDEGKTITIANEGSGDSYYTDTLSFTYMNYGYVGYVGGDADTELTMTVFEITDNQVTVSRYNDEGVYVLKAAGVSGNGNPTADTNIVNSGETIALTIPVSDGNEGDSGNTDSGNTESGTTIYTLDSDGIDVGEDYLIVSTGSDRTGSALTNNSGSSTGTTVTIADSKIEVDNDNLVWNFSDSERGNAQNGTTGYYIYPSSTDGEDPIIRNKECDLLFSHKGDGEYTIQRDNSYSSLKYYVNASDDWTYSSNETSVYLYKKTGSSTGSGTTVTPEDLGWVTVSDGSGKIIYELDTDGVNAGKNYLIVNTSQNGPGNALTNNEGRASNTKITITDNVIKVEDDSNITWTTSGNSNKASFKNGNQYIYLSHNNGVLYTLTRSLIITHLGEGKYTLKRDSNSSGYYVNYSSSEGWEELTTTESTVYLFRETGIEPAGDAEYAKIDGELTYTVSRGATEEEALAAVKEGINVIISSSADGSNATILPDDNENITWDIVSYDGTTAGEYAVKIYYKDKYLGTVKVIVPEVIITGYELLDYTGTVHKGASKNAETGAYIEVRLEDGTSYNVPVTVGMLSKDGAAVSTKEITTHEGLTVSYNGKTFDNFTLNVTAKAGNNYPEYPNEGAVKVNKTATGIDFQSSGIAQVEISTSGIPMNQGVDVVIILDTSSSMTREIEDLDGGTRIEVLRPAVDDLIQQLKTKREDGSDPDIDIAIASFNANTMAEGNNYISDDDGDPAYDQRADYGLLTDKTGDGWVDVMTLDDDWGTQNNGNNIKTGSGTNYDYGLQMAYDLLAQKQADNETERQQFVIFMSDGAPYQFNGVYSNGGESEWVNWVLGNYQNEDEIPDTVSDKNKKFYYGYAEGTGQKHRIAEAIKGDASETFDIVSFENDASGELVSVPGLGATVYSIGLLLVDETNNNITAEHQASVLKKIASNEELFYDIDTADGLGDAFTKFADDVLMAAYNARFVDQMGDDFDLRMKTSTYEVVENGDTTSKTLAPEIKIISYDIYTRQDYLNGEITEDKIGDRKGTYTTLETVTFSADGTEAYSDQINGGETNILADGTQKGYVKGVIYAKTFLYNTNISEVAVDGVNIPTGTKTDGTTTGTANKLPSETFYWNMGNVQSSELAMRYYVYLEGSMEGTREAGSYPTNEYATLYYDNYLENPCYKDTVSPVMAWKEANVSYAFYLVDENGNIIVNQTTGQTGSFANKIAVTNPVVYETVLLNNDEEVSSIDIASLGVLPEGYTLYDYDGTNGATYTVTINSNTTGAWNITSVKNVATTYVTQYDPSNASAYSNQKNVNEVGLDYTHTVVWFAVLWKVQALPDAVVIDYGLPVDISVLTNDMFGENGNLAGVGAYSDNLKLEGFDTTVASGFGDSYTGTYGEATANIAAGKVRYTPNTMEMNGYDKFAYAVKYTGTTNSGYYYDTVTIIPATTIYYEEDYLTLNSYTWDYTKEAWAVKSPGLWSVDGTTVDGVQEEDRPGKYSLTDANNIYGYDDVNLKLSTYSMGSALKATVDYDNKAEASFEFWGTGFDVISMTNVDTGTIYVDVYDAQGKLLEGKSFIVDTYYGYEQNADGDWIIDTDNEDSIYQVPVIKVENLTYAKYKVVISAIYDPIYEHIDGSVKYEFYLDAIRIYDPANDGIADGTTDTTIEDAYKADGEGWPSYIELRNQIISQETLGNAKTDTVVTGLVFIDGDPKVDDAQLEDYISYGPNNEVYLAPGQRVAFILSTPSNIANVHIGIKSADGEKGTYTITNIARVEDSENNISAGMHYNPITYTIDTTTDMYYDLTGWKNDIIVISNTGDLYNTTGIISLTNIKSTYNSKPNEAATVSEVDTYGISTVSMDQELSSNETYMYMTPAAATLTLRTVNAPVEEETPDEVLPEEPGTDVTVPETPDDSDSETEKPQPEEPGTGDTESEDDAGTNMIDEVINTIKNVFNWLFGWKGAM